MWIVCASGPFGSSVSSGASLGAGRRAARSQRDQQRSAPAAGGSVGHQPSPSATVVVVLALGAGRDVRALLGALAFALLAVLLLVVLDGPLAAGGRHDAGGDDAEGGHGEDAGDHVRREPGAWRRRATPMARMSDAEDVADGHRAERGGGEEHAGEGDDRAGDDEEAGERAPRRAP